jgi:hypothetical protein
MLNKLLLYILYTITILVIVTSIMSFIDVPFYVYNPYIYYIVMLFVFDLILIPQTNLY